MKYDNLNKQQLIAHIERLETANITLRERAAQGSLDTAFLSLVDQLASTLDSKLDGTLITYTDQDSPTGHSNPSNRDMGLRIVLGQLTQTIHNQLVPNAKSKGAIHYLNLFKETKNSDAFKDRYAKGELMPDDLKLLKQLADQQARVEFLSMLKDTFQAAYEKTTRETWKPYVRSEDITSQDKIDNNRLANLMAA